MMKSDIEIAQEAVMLPIQEVAAQLDLTEDDLKQAEKKTQDLTDKYCKEIDSMQEKKQKEIMEI